MAIQKHSLSVLDGSTATFTDRQIIGVLIGVANASGAAGVAVTTPVTFAEPLPATYTALVMPNQDATAFITAKTNAGFSVTLTPRLAANALAAGTFDVILFA